MDVLIEEPERGDYDQRFHFVGGFDLPSAYDLSVTVDTLNDTQTHPNSRYRTAEIATGLTEIPTLDDVEDIDWTDVSASYDVDIEDEIELSSSVSSSNVTGWHFEIAEDEDIVSEMWETSGGAGGAPLSGNGGLMSSFWGWIAALITGVTGAVGYAKAKATNSGSR
jgi:hypothetical protein